MLLSMTGFGSLTFSIVSKRGVKINLLLTLKSLNSRFFELNCKLPYSLSHLETKLIKLFKQELGRGSIFCSLHISNPVELTGTINPAFSVVDNYLKAISAIQEKFSVPGKLEISDLIKLSNIFEIPEEPIDEKTENIIMDLFKKLADQVVRQEGRRCCFRKGSLQRIAMIEKTYCSDRRESPYCYGAKKTDFDAGHSSNFKDQIADTHDASANNYLYSQLERIDIHEEIVRAKAHLANLKSSILNGVQENGKKLDFILQEIFREINTIASKCNDSIISSLSIDIKVEQEKAREQVQNIV